MKKTLYPIIHVLLICVASSLFAQKNMAVLLHTGATSFPENIREYVQNASIASDEMIGDHYYRLVQFNEIPAQSVVEQLKAEGVLLLEYIPHLTYLVSIPTHFDLNKLVQAGARSIQLISSDMKMSTNLKSGNIPDWSVERNNLLAMLKFYKDLDHISVERFCESDGIEIITDNGYNNFLRVKIPLDRIDEVAGLPYVAFLDLVPAPDVPDDINGRSLHRANVIDAEFSGGRHYTGEGVSVLCRDDGPVGPHIDFMGRIDNTFTEPQTGTHGDGVSGIMCGAGNLDPRNKGMASGAHLYVTNYQADFLDETMDLHFNNGVLVTNSSYSNGCNAGYTQVTETVDQQLYNNPTLLHVFSAGNSNNQNCNYGAGSQWGNITGGHKQAKNCIATANLWADAELVNSSSRGPAHDGRIKPDIAANGADHISTDENNDYQVFGGTSGAAPGIAGITAQLHQAYREMNNGEIAEAALLKAMLLNSTNDLGNKGPDFKFGWGHVNAYRAALTLEEGRYMKEKVEPAAINEHTITIPENVAQSRVMVYWMDPEATVMSSKALVNDIDIWMTDQSGTEYSPWKLDPTPNPTSLDSPAVPGVDSLNNVEQVAIDFPEAGEYTLHVQGSELPFGAHDYFIVWEFRTEDITLTHPYGGEAFAPNETVRIHWDTHVDPVFFVISYSNDGGATYTDIGTAPGTQRMFDWNVPNEATGHALIKVRKGAAGPEDVCEAEFTIARRPINLNITQACPDYIKVQWSPVDLSSAGSTTRYEVLLLGDKYMEPIDTTDLNEYEVPTIFGLGQPYWIAVRTLGDDGIRSERSVAVNYSGGLYNCILPNDMALVNILSPQPGNLSGCNLFDSPVIVEVSNTGSEPQTDVEVGYQLNNNAVVSETIEGTLAPGETIVYEFSTGLSIDTGGDFNLEVMTLLPGDEVVFNDNQDINFSISIYPGNGAPLEYKEDFESGVFPPDYYQINNFDNSTTWQLVQNVGSTGNPTSSLFMDNYSYNTNGEEDELITIPIDLSGSSSPVLKFDVAYAQFSDNFTDGLRVIVSDDCGGSFTDIVYEKFSTELATVPDMNSEFSPNSANQWRIEQVDLSPYVDKSIVIKFVNINGYGNSLFLDNININEAGPPSAGFNVASNTVCQGETVTFEDASSGVGLSYDWSFGNDASPSTSTEAGPVDVIFNEPGTYTVELTVTNAAGSDVVTQDITVESLPLPDFDVTATSDTVNYINLSQFATSYSWDFGDGNTSDESDPEHIYELPGTYTVVLTATNDCGSMEITQEIDVIFTGVNELDGRIDAVLTPNPTNGAFTLRIQNNRSELLSVEIKDITGVSHQSRKIQTAAGVSGFGFNAGDLPSGLYLIEIRGNDGFKVLKLIVE